MNKKQKILTILGLSLVLVSVLFASNQVWAQEKTNPFGVVGDILGGLGDKVIGSVFYAIGLLLGGLAAIIAMIAGWLVNFAINLNFNILQNPIIDIGWRISRDIANLGFVLFIIIIAIATILRMQQYGAKSALGKLIAVALLVNFSLVFAGVFIDFSNMLTNFFIKNISGGSLSNLSGVIFNSTDTHNLTQVSSSTLQTAPAASTGGWINHAVSLILIATLTAIAAFCMFAFAIMFLVRFISVSFLLILAPLACLFVILPTTKKIWDQWWNEFTKWMLFAPAASFFLYMGVYLTTNYESWIGGLSQSAKGIGTAIPVAEPTLIADLFSKIANLIITGGFMLGGLMAANSFGLQGVKLATGFAQNTRKWIQGKIGRTGIQYGGAFLRRKGTEEGAQSLAEKAQTWAAKQTGFGRYAAGWVARGATRLATSSGEDQVKYHEKQVAGMSIPDTEAALLTAFGPRKIALINKLTKAGQLGNTDMTRIATKDTQKLFASFGQGKQFSDTGKAGFMSVEMNEARIKGDENGLSKATESLIAKFTKKDVEPAAFKDLFGGSEKRKFGLDKEALKKMSQYIAKAISVKNPGLVANILPKLDSKSRNNFKEAYEEAIKDASPNIQDMFKKTMDNYTLGFSPTEAAETTKT
ncbi:hypothetical protein A2819_00885 [Candidatus Azambacteria bacterium RIFCSPHIGHO2_01_FULL_40_24]|uniref:Uncharacterized protein n=1 Tax=Candidatus Azambacteria bacterium RIFCSPHIGHO2_01_FULL_40_24 TaxID=1797301 RepID=A0A1F5B365_9BACT|nr:MAG: hypothetical protein A2819_00885 [Candidatus Azambacteria bacterium RIFCSPHIGHO2_01_FULL_40_24]